MLRIGKIGITLLAMSVAAVANASDLRDFCADRPGKGTPPCILDTGHVQAEMSLIDFTHDRSPDAMIDTALVGDMLVRAGVSQTTELRLGWTPLGIVRTRDRTTNAVIRSSGVGDVMLGFRTSLKNPDGSGLSIAVQPSVSLPVGSSAIGAGTWGASLVVPVSFQLSPIVQVALSPEVDAAPNGDSSGRHARYGGVFGIGVPVTSAISAGVELAAFRDDDPSGHTTNATADLTLAWTPQSAKGLQFDAGLYAGLNSDTPDLQAVIGVAKRF
jgi:Putative MetA-pathway of phenol degradation